VRILHSYKVYGPEFEGGIPYVIATLTGQHAADLDNRILVARKKGLSKKYQLDGVPVEAVTSLGTLFSTPLAPSFPFKLINRAEHCDIVVHHAPFPLADLALYRLPPDVALVVYWHADIVGFPLLKSIVKPATVKTLQRADRIIVADQSTIANSHLLHAFAYKCTVIPYGTDVERWSDCTESEIMESNSLRQKHPRLILGIGRLVTYKGFAVLLEALREIDGHLVLIGEGPLATKLETLADDFGTSGKVTFAGRLPSATVKAYLHAARVLAFPSVTTAEAFGIVQLEAMAAGLPIVNTALATAVPRVARHEQEALTVAPNNPKALAEALRRILDNPCLAERLGRAGKARATLEYGESTYVRRVRNVYEGLLPNRK